ncbi:unnamed protein product [Prorocentrum cordatum]|uniref:Large ribosomal subunit protein bL31c n=1 Tax=Prorocentrum cordatum TaxID=2364126 RepID=A0ABN9PS52_9DINO|nr:unnamed protein product [Polarella glacialis]|mmetsp:Transcript_50830/g.116227  ORF Transcript_50830/g.116227 Transcript_50830/m.116227 type:complete len:189 (+) Transcript_50830:64-630(+)
MAGRGRSACLGAVLALLALWAAGSACADAVAFVTAGLGWAPRSGRTVAMQAMRGWTAGNVQKGNKGAGGPANMGAAKKEKKSKENDEDQKTKVLPTYNNVPVIFNGNKVTAINGTIKEYKVDIWSGAHPVWQGKKNKVMLDAGSLTRFQDKYGAMANIFGDTGLEQLEENKRVKAEMEERRKQGLQVY